MTRYRHPRNIGVDDPAQFAVDLGGDHVDLDPDGTFEHDAESDVRALAQAHGCTVSDLRVDDSGTCDVEKADGEICGRELPCPYHDGGGDD